MPLGLGRNIMEVQSRCQFACGGVNSQVTVYVVDPFPFFFEFRMGLGNICFINRPS